MPRRTTYTKHAQDDFGFYIQYFNAYHLVQLLVLYWKMIPCEIFEKVIKITIMLNYCSIIKIIYNYYTVIYQA